MQNACLNPLLRCPFSPLILSCMADLRVKNQHFRVKNNIFRGQMNRSGGRMNPPLFHLSKSAIFHHESESTVSPKDVPGEVSPESIVYKCIAVKPV